MSSIAARLQSPRLQRRIVWIAFAVLAAGVIAFVVTHYTNTAKSTQAPLTPNVPVKDVSKNPKTIKLEPQATKVAREFILTAVARKDLRKAWTLAGPMIRQDMTLKQWLTGNIPVIPYPADAIDFAPMKIDYSYPKEALIEVALLPKKGANVKGQLFGMQLDKISGHWVVQSWVPRGTPPVPCASSGNC